jgi:16S rRNA (guanine527-N7)-methyltransferase
MTKLLLAKALADNQLTLTETQQQQLSDYLALLNQWNKVYNLTAITDTTQQITKHLIDSLVVSPLLKGAHCLDVGTGPGLPGIPLAIINPEKSFTLVECNQKKTRFLIQAKTVLGLSNIHIVAERIEHYQPAEPFDTILSRAFSSTDQLLSLTKTLIAENGQWLAMKGQHPEQELNKISEDFVVEDVRQLFVSGLDADRHVIILKRR